VQIQDLAPGLATGISARAAPLCPTKSFGSLWSRSRHL
jgi:hypothetical protein